MTSPARGRQLQGAARLATEASAGLVDLVEAMHERIARLPGLPPPPTPGRTRGLTGLVYKTVRGATRLVGGSVDALLGLIGPALDADDSPSPRREAIVAALNGVLGDHLEASGNALATPMSWRHDDGRALLLERAALAQALPAAGSDLLVLVHGLCMNDRLWRRQGHDHGEVLAQALGATPIYLRYNSGRRVTVNGRDFADALQQLVASWPTPVRRLVIVAHSMGGLVARSAWAHGTAAGHSWLAPLSDIVFLGTPHQGAPLERAGHGVDWLLGATPYTAPFVRLARLRSAGITDLRHGRVLDEADGDPHPPLPPPERVRCLAVAGCIGAAGGALKDRWLGDGLVPLDSALGRHADPARALAFAADHQWVGQNMHHLDLLGRREVADQMRLWLSAGAGPRDAAPARGAGRRSPAAGAPGAAAAVGVRGPRAPAPARRRARPG